MQMLHVRVKDHFLVQGVLTTSLDHASAGHRGPVGAQSHPHSCRVSWAQDAASLATPLPPSLMACEQLLFMCSLCTYFWMFFLLQDANLSLKARLYQWGLG